MQFTSVNWQFTKCKPVVYIVSWQWAVYIVNWQCCGLHCKLAVYKCVVYIVNWQCEVYIVNWQFTSMQFIL